MPRRPSLLLPMSELPSRPYLASERAAEHYCDEVVDGQGRLQYLDLPCSVSALIEIETDCDYDRSALGPFTVLDPQDLRSYYGS